MRKCFTTLTALALAAFFSIAVPIVAWAESSLTAVSAFPATHPFTISLQHFIDLVNKEAKGVLSIKYIGGPEITPPSKQPIALRNGLFDLMYGPPAYYLGLFPEGDAFDGFKLPAETRKVGGFKYIDAAMRERLAATFVGRFDAGGGLFLFLTRKPKLTADGDVDLSGLKIRSSPAYGDFLRALGGTAVVMDVSETYTALERGVVDGAATGLSGLRESSLTKFLKFRIEPNFSVTSTILIGNAKKIDALPPEAHKKLFDIARQYEDISMKATLASEKSDKDLLAKEGEEAVILKGKAGERFVETYMRYPWGRMEKNSNIKLDMAKLRTAFR
jgi:TRAP-type C4-dicarboxylate transport system substrate-binding protein